MELIVNRQDKNKVYTFEGELGSQVWESEPVTRFRFKKPVDNEWIKTHLAANYPTAGIVFEGIPYIGTNDGFIYTQGKKIQRIPEILVDTELFIDEYKFASPTEKRDFIKYKKNGYDALYPKSKSVKNKSLIQRIMNIMEPHNNIRQQEHNLDRYLTNALAIRGFVINKAQQYSEEILYDGHLLGITETKYGNSINDLIPEVLYQINPTTAAFVPMGYPMVPNFRITIENGIEKRKETFCVDYHSLWDITGKGRWVEDICPRDGSGCARAKFATDGEIIAISHGNHPWYSLDILKQTRNGKEKVKSIELDPSKISQKLLIKEGMVFGDYGEVIRNFSREIDIFHPENGGITSIADSGLCTVLSENETETTVFDPFKYKPIAQLKGDYVFLPRAPQ